MFYLNLNKNSDRTLTRQIYDSMKDAILLGRLKSKEKLPSTRELAKQLEVSRNVVIDVYEQLLAEGYLESKEGSGTYVCDGVVFTRDQEREQTPHCVTAVASRKITTGKHVISFRTGIPELREIPIKRWGQMYQKMLLNINPSQLDYQDPMGSMELRIQIASYLNRARGTCARPEHIMITNGAAQSFSMLCQIISKKEYALVENPLSYGILNTLKSCHVGIRTINLDSDEILTSNLPYESPKLIFTTPSHQFPTGVVLPAKRRIELLQYAREHNSFVVEDDYDSEFRFEGSPIPSMQYLDPEHVIYVGTFSKTFMPSLRIGYMVLPSQLCEEMRTIKYVADLHSPVLEQLTMASFIESGQFERHIRKMGKLYRKKRDMLITCLTDVFGEQVKLLGANAGLHFVASFPRVDIKNEILVRIAEDGVEISPIKKHYVTDDHGELYNHALLMGYGNLHIEDIEKGVSVLTKVLKR